MTPGQKAYSIFKATLVVSVIALTMVLGSSNIRATSTHVVTSGSDSGPGTLRQAVLDAADGDTIEFHPSISTITLTSGEIILNKNLNILGPGPGVLAVIRDSNAPPFRIFQVTGGSILLSGLAVAGGADSGGGVLNDGNLHLVNCLLANNKGVNAGAILNRNILQITNSTFSDNSANNFGGAVVNLNNILEVVNSTFSGNSVAGAGRGYSGPNNQDKFLRY